MACVRASLLRRHGFKGLSNLSTYSLGIHWTYLPSGRRITPSDEAAASSSEMIRVRDTGMPTLNFFWSNAGSPSVGQSFFQCPGLSQRLQV